MNQPRRIYYSTVQRCEIWDRWQAGEPMSPIRCKFDRDHWSAISDLADRWHLRPPESRTAFRNERNSIDGRVSAARCGRSHATLDDPREAICVEFIDRSPASGDAGIDNPHSITIAPRCRSTTLRRPPHRQGDATAEIGGLAVPRLFAIASEATAFAPCPIACQTS